MPVLKSGFRSWDVLLIFLVGEGDCMCESAVGQFNIFGATEEKLRRRFPAIFPDQEKSAKAVGDAHDRESS
jgi:hypothetical protein